MSIANPTTPVRLDANSNGMILDPEEFDAVHDWDDECRYELIHGVVVVSPISTVLLPGFELPLARIIAVADEWR